MAVEEVAEVGRLVLVGKVMRNTLGILQQCDNVLN